MKILDVLRKLGILRYGTKAATYTSMRDKPAELFMDGVFNADKDLVNREDVNKAAAAVKSLEGRKIMFWAVLPLCAFALLMFVAGSGLTVWFCIDVALVGGLSRGPGAVRLWGPLLLRPDDHPAGGPGSGLDHVVGGRGAGKMSGALVAFSALLQNLLPTTIVSLSGAKNLVFSEGLRSFSFVQDDIKAICQSFFRSGKPDNPSCPPFNKVRANCIGIDR